MREHKYILKGKKPVRCPDVLKWGKWFEASFQNECRIVAKTKVGRKRVSTVFLGLDHSFMGKGELLLFETMIFTPTKAKHLLKMGIKEKGELYARIDTWENAEKLHKKCVKQLKRKYVNK